MLTKLRAFASLYRELGPRWTLFRLAYAFRLRTAVIRLQMPVGEWDDYKHHITTRSAGRVAEGVSRPSESPKNIFWNPQIAIDEADKILNGELKYFSHQFIKTGFPLDWHKDYFSNHVTLSEAKGLSHDEQDSAVVSRRSHRPDAVRESDMNKHWSQLSDDSSSDIKFIWEPNRFAFVYTLVRAYIATHNEKYPDAFWTLIEDWAEKNPPNTGVNWMDGQEIALRLMAWTFGFYQFSNSPSSTPHRKQQFLLYVAAQAERIYKNICYAISTRSNHTISEAFGLWMVGLLFPELKHSEKYLSLGKQLLEQEAANQIFPDGSYSMYSLNYHRFILHIYLYAIRLGEINDPSLRGGSSSEAYRDPMKQSPTRFSDDVYRAVTKSVEYLACLIDPQTGQMPVYGSNDGALVLPLNNCDFTDYRPLLQLGWYFTKGEFLFEPGPWDEDVYWLCGESFTAKHAKGVKEDKNLSELRALRGESFPNGGVYLLHNTHSQAFIRCTDFTSRPSHADQLHVDLWMQGRNIAIDAGTYLYSGQGIWRNGLARTSVHNTITVDGKDQMTLLSRFTWTNWSKGKVLKHERNLWQGEHVGYKPVTHRRTVISLEGDRWLVVDNLVASESHNYKLHWLLADGKYGAQELAPAKFGIQLEYPNIKLSDSKPFIQVGMLKGDGKFSIVRADPNSTRGWRSRYYGHKEPAISVMFEVHQPQVTFWSFFGFENDKVELVGKVLWVNGTEINLKAMDDRL
jgi:asparagine synthase (glutamine-hydrolysing)